MFAALLLFAGCDTSSCNGGGGLDLNNGVDPAPEVPAQLVDVFVPERGDVSVWSSAWDNPPVSGLAHLFEYQAADRNGQYSEANEWVYTDFDLVATIDPPSANPAPPGASPDGPRVLYTWPLEEGNGLPPVGFRRLLGRGYRGPRSWSGHWGPIGSVEPRL